MNLKDLTLNEKITLLTGKNSWQTDDLGGKINSVFMADGPHGLRKMATKTQYNRETGEKEEATYTVNSTSYPALSVVANGWSRENARLMADCIAEDCVENDVDILLAPGVNIKRTPLCGRNFEYFSEDPYLAGELAYEYIDGLQRRGVGTSLKHFACNNAEDYRHYQNSQVDERTFFEIYMPAFERALEAKPWTVMCSYNLLNGVYSSENKRLLKEILRDKFGFDGLIVSDWQATHHRARALKATLDLEMPHRAEAAAELRQAYDDGFITESEIDESVTRILQLIEKAQNAKKTRKVTRTVDERHAQAVKIAEEGIVLLKNDGILPLKRNASINFYSSTASYTRNAGGGSATVTTGFKSQPLYEVLKSHGYEIKGKQDGNPSLLPVVVLSDSTADYKIVCVATENYESEGYDRRSIKIDKYDEECVKKLTSIYNDVIVLIFASSAVDCSAFKDSAAAILFVGFCGEGQNEAIINILTGKTCPSGKLSETFFNTIEDCPVNKAYEFENTVNYDERIYVGYRYADTYGVTPAFAFGHGLSYAKFEYSDLQIKKLSELDYEVSYSVKNTSNVAGKEVSQVYVQDCVCISDRPEKELKGFSKDLILPNETKRITVRLNKRSFAYYLPAVHDFHVENGKFKILVGAASDDIRLSGEITVSLPEYEQFAPSNGRYIQY